VRGRDPELGIICVVLLIVIPIGLMIGALILRAAVWLANKCLTAPVSRYDDDEEEYDDDWDEYDRPARRRGRRNNSTAIPEPSFGWAMLIVFVNWIVNAGVGFVMGVAAGGAGLARDPGAMLVLQGCSLVVNFFISAGLLTAMLPTTFPRACLVVLFQFLIALAIAVVIVVPLLVIGGMRMFR